MRLITFPLPSISSTSVLPSSGKGDCWRGWKREESWSVWPQPHRFLVMMVTIVVDMMTVDELTTILTVLAFNPTRNSQSGRGLPQPKFVNMEIVKVC